jgi:heat shock protein HtpX
VGNQIKTLILLGGLTAIIMIFGQLIGGQTGLIIAFVIAMVMNIGAYWFSASIVLAQTKARVVTEAEAPELYALVRHLADNAGLPMPKVAIVNNPSPNAFATGRNPSHAVVAVTQGLLNIMNREELAGVLSHELAHVKHRDILICSIAAVMASVIMLLATMAKYGAMIAGMVPEKRRGIGESAIFSMVVTLLMALLAPLAAALIQAAISRSREYLADEGGADIAQTPEGLASALEKLGRVSSNQAVATHTYTTPSYVTLANSNLFIVNPLSVQSFSSLFATHPPLEERIQRLRGLRD